MQDLIPDEDIDRLCDQFEQELSSGGPASIDSFLERIDESRQPSLLYWLLTVQLQSSQESIERKRQSLADLRRKYPQFETAIDRATLSLDDAGSPLPTIPGYTVKRRVMRGGQGEVFQAIQDRTGQDVAIKLLSSRQLETIPQVHRLSVVDRLEKEIRTAAGLNHPNIVKVFDAGECDAGFYFVMQWVKGGSLANRGTVSQLEAARIIRSVANALAEAHSSDVLHLDVKPHNILMDQATEQPLLADFGLARLSQETTESNAIAGTLGYMAPEQAQGAKLDVRTDVYGLGATLYELLTGQKANEGVSLPYDESQRDAWQPSSPRVVSRDVNPELERICLKCLQFDPAERYQSCLDVVAALDRFSFTEDGRRIAKMAKRTLFTCPLFFAINLVVMIQINFGWADHGAFEPFVWMTMFSMYGVVLYVFCSLGSLDRHSPEHLAIEGLWAVWGAKCLAAIAVAASLRLMASHAGGSRGESSLGSVEEAMLMCYPMFSALTGMVLATMAPRYWRPLYGLAVVSWASSILLMWTIAQASTIAPAIYGATATVLAFLWGLKLRRLSREQESTIPFALEPTIDLLTQNAGNARS